MTLRLGCILVLCVAAAACSSSDRFRGDAGHHSLDGGVQDGGAPSNDALAGLGKACKHDSDCPQGLFCDEEIPGSLKVAGAPGGSINLPLFPGGSCSPLPLTTYDPDGGTSCDPARPQAAEGCGPNGKCLSEAVDTGTVVGCRVLCEPSETKTGCARSGYTCELSSHACVEGCASDAECRVHNGDSNGDGVADTIVYDTKSSATCDPHTLRCTHPAAAGAHVGTPCAMAVDCEADGACIDAASSLASMPFPDGLCTKFGCDVNGRECGDGSVCEALRPWRAGAVSVPACLTSCRVGAEPAAQRLGTAGHGDGCRAGYRCHYNGGAGADDGVCVGGNYNAVAKNNVGDTCDTDADCYSPFGYGRCLYLTLDASSSPAHGTCSVMDCAAPGMPKDLCGSGNECILLRADITFCVRDCSKASQCAAGSACADDDGDESTKSVCFPACFSGKECRTGETCQIPNGMAGGQCVALAGKGG